MPPNSEFNQLQEEMKHQGEAIKKIEAFIEIVSKALHRLTELNVHHEEHSKALERAFKLCDGIEKRVSHVEQELPTIIIAKQMVFKGATVVLGLVLVALVGLAVV